MNEIKSKSDYNELYTRNKRFRVFTKRIVYSRLIFTFLLILLQILLLVFFISKLKPYIEYFFGGSILLSFLFMVYLTNSPGKNEFKMAWMLPLILFPIFGIATYIFYRTNPGGRITQNNVKKIKTITDELCDSAEDSKKLLNDYPEISGLGNYLINAGNYVSYTNSTVKYFQNGETFYPDFFEEIKNAKKYIFIEFFIIAVDESWTTLVKLLEEKVNQGVEVRVLYDGLGSTMMSTHYYEKYLESKGIKTRIFLPLIPFLSTQLNNRNHRKIVIIDGKISYTGGLNIKNEYFNLGDNRFAYWKDNGIKIQGPAIKTLLMLFLQDWNLNNSKPDNFETYLKTDFQFQSAKGIVIPYGDDAYNNADIAEDVYLSILKNAKKYVHITTPYLLLDNQLQNALILTARSGVEVSLVVPSKADHLLTFCIGKTYLKTLINAGVKVYLYNKGFIHAKTFISDDVTATVGTVNLDYRSLYHHFECGVVMHYLPVISDIEKDFQDTLKDCTQMFPEDYKKIPKRYRFLGRLFRIFAPLM